MLPDKIVIVTGGAGLLGRVFIEAIVENGGIGIIADIDEKISKSVIEGLNHERQSDRVDFVKLDITSKKSVQEMISNVANRYGKIDALVNNAYPRNKHYGRKFEEVTYEDFCENINMHLGGYFLMSQQMAMYFKEQRYGNIINMSSIYGLMAPRFEVYKNSAMTMPVEYAAIKASVIQLTKYMAAYYKGYNIRVNAISPGGILDHQPEAFLAQYKSYALNKGMLDANDLKGTLIYLLSDLSRYVNGQNVIVDDGYTL